MIRDSLILPSGLAVGVKPSANADRHRESGGGWWFDPST